MRKTNSQAEANEARLAEEALKKRAARQAVKNELVPKDDEIVVCTVLPMGDGKISMGSHAAGVGEAHYDEGEKFSVPKAIAVALYRRGFVNFSEARQAVKDADEADAEKRAAEKAAAEIARQAAEENG